MKKYLKLFLDELPKQTYFQNLEIVLDHNEPDEEEIMWVREFQKKYPNKIKHIIIKNVDPIGISMNRCIKESTGEFLTIWNVDDLRTSNSIELQAQILTENINFDIVYGDYEVVDSFGKKNGKIVVHEKFPPEELTRSMIIGPFFMFRKEICNKAGYFDEQLKSGADFDFAIRLALHGVAKSINKNLGYYLNEGLGASTRPNSKQPLERTVIELRYGIYDKIDYSFLPDALNYEIYNTIQFGKKIPVNDLAPNYQEYISKQKDNLFLLGMKNFLKKKKAKKYSIKKFIKKIIR